MSEKVLQGIERSVLYYNQIVLRPDLRLPNQKAFFIDDDIVLEMHISIIRRFEIQITSSTENF